MTVGPHPRDSCQLQKRTVMTEESRDGAGGDDALRTLISDDASAYLQRKCLAWRHLEDEVGRPKADVHMDRLPEENCARSEPKSPCGMDSVPSFQDWQQFLRFATLRDTLHVLLQSQPSDDAGRSQRDSLIEKTLADLQSCSQSDENGEGRPSFEVGEMILLVAPFVASQEL